MALTDAQRQAARRDRLNTSIDELTKANALLIQENSTLRAENDALKAKLHQIEIAALKAQLKEAKKSAS